MTTTFDERQSKWPQVFGFSLPRRYFGSGYFTEEGLYWWELVELLEDRDRRVASGGATSEAAAVTALTTVYRFWFEYGNNVDFDNVNAERLRNIPRPPPGFPTSQPPSEWATRMRR